MFCPSCRSNIPNNLPFCPVCGFTIKVNRQTQNQPSNPQQSPYQQRSPYQQHPPYQQQTPYQQRPTYQQRPQYQQQPIYQQPPQYQRQSPYQQRTPYQQQSPYGQATYHQQAPYKPQPSYQPQPAAQGMIWFKFLIYFSLFASATLNILIGIVKITGSHYNHNAEDVYSAIEELQIIDIASGLLLFIFAIFSLYTRFSLSSFCKSGPTALKLLYIFDALLNLLIIISYSFIETDSLFISFKPDYVTPIISIIADIAMIFINHIYFSKRASLFKN